MLMAPPVLCDDSSRNHTPEATWPGATHHPRCSCPTPKEAGEDDLLAYVGAHKWQSGEVGWLV